MHVLQLPDLILQALLLKLRNLILNPAFDCHNPTFFPTLSVFGDDICQLDAQSDGGCVRISHKCSRPDG